MNIYNQLRNLYHKLILLENSHNYGNRKEIIDLKKEIVDLELLINSVNYYPMNDMLLVIMSFIRTYEKKECFYIKDNDNYCIKDYDNNVLFYLIHKTDDIYCCDIYNPINIDNPNANNIYDFIDYLYNKRINNNISNVLKGDLFVYVNEYINIKRKVL